MTEEGLSVEPEWQALDRGVTLRVVYHPGFDPERLTELGLFAKKGERSRTAPVPMKLILVDSHTALIPSMRSYNPGHELRASIVKHALLVEALQWLFEAVWDASVPIMASFSADTDPRRQMLVSLLMTGSTDSAIANTLNINVRSVRRWISELMDELGVTTRLQLGAALVRSDALRGDMLARTNVRRRTDLEATPAVQVNRGRRPGGGDPSGTSGKVPHGLTRLVNAHNRRRASGNVRYPGFLTEDLVLAA